MTVHEVTITHVLTEQGHEFRADRKNSPPFQFEPLSPSPRPRTARPMPQRTPSPSDDDNEARTYPFVLRKPFKDPYETLFDAHNVAQLFIATIPTNLPRMLDLIVLQDGPFMPTHILAIYDTPDPTIPSGSAVPQPTANPPILAPINAEQMTRKFTNDFSHFFPELYSGSSSYEPPSSHWDEQRRRMIITLPVIQFVVPHPPSFTLLLLFGLGLHANYDLNELEEVPPSPSDAPQNLEPDSSPSYRSAHSDSSFSSTPSMQSSTSAHSSAPEQSSTSAQSSTSTSASSPNTPHPLQIQSTQPSRSTTPYPLGQKTSTGLLATYLLPIRVIEEFPAANAMAQILARRCSLQKLQSLVEFNGGLWRNTLSLAPKDTDIIEIVRTAWNVTREAKRLLHTLRTWEVMAQ